MDLDSVRVFIKVAELGSFTRAAEHLGLSKARASVRVTQLEAELGSRLLQRTTRAVRLTADGEQFLVRARRLVLDAEEIVGLFQSPSNLRGRVRVDLPVNLARNFIIPRLPEFLASHPQLEVLLSTTDRRVDVVRESFDCVLRVGLLADSGLALKKLGTLPLVNCASPAYLLRYGTPHTLADLEQHLVVHYSPSLGAEPPSFEYRDGAHYRDLAMRCLVTVNSADAYQSACLAGLGIIQTPRIGARAALAERALVEVLPDLRPRPLPVSLVHPHAGGVPKRIRVFMTWLAQLLEPHLDH